MNWLFYSLSENLAWSRMGVWQRSSVVVLLIMVLYASIGFAVKARLLRRARISSRDFAPAAASALREGKIEEAIEVSRTFEKGGSHLAGLVLVALEEVMQGRSSGTPNSTIMVIVREKMEQDASKRSFEWKSGLGPLDAIGRTSPFVGAAVGTPFGLFVGRFWQSRRCGFALTFGRIPKELMWSSSMWPARYVSTSRSGRSVRPWSRRRARCLSILALPG